MSFAENKQKKVEGGETPATSPQSFQTKNASEYTEGIKYQPQAHNPPLPEGDAAMEYAEKYKNFRKWYRNAECDVAIKSGAEKFLPKMSFNFTYFQGEWAKTKDQKTWSKNSQEFNEVSRALERCITFSEEFDTYLQKQATGKDANEMKYVADYLANKLLPALMRASHAYIEKNNKLIIWSAVGRERFRLANNILVQAACARKYLGVYCLNESAQVEDSRNRGIIQGRITLTGRRCSKMDTTIANMKSNDCGEEFVSCMNDMNNCLQQMNSIPGKGNYGQIKQKLDALITRYNERKYNQAGVSVDIFYLAKELEELCYAYTRRFGKPTTEKIDNHLTLVSNIAMRAIMIQQQCKQNAKSPKWGRCKASSWG